MKVQFFLRFHTEFGQSLLISGNTGELGNDDLSSALLMTYLNDEFWVATIELKQKKIGQLRYKYLLKTKDGEIIPEFGNAAHTTLKKMSLVNCNLLIPGIMPANLKMLSSPLLFKKQLKGATSGGKAKSPKHVTHIFKVKAPLLQKNEVLCLAGIGKALNNWSIDKPLLMSKDENWWIIKADLSEENFPVAYKYGVYNKKEKEFLRFENGNNRSLYSEAGKKKITIVHDGFAYLPNNTWKGAGVAIPVFSLRSKNSFGVGEFTDLKLLVDWAKTVGLKLIQILPVNDTTATHTWTDSYPYAAISAFALHPIYLDLGRVAGKKHADRLHALKRKQKQLNDLPEMDYEQVMKFKLAMLKELCELQETNVSPVRIICHSLKVISIGLYHMLLFAISAINMRLRISAMENKRGLRFPRC